MIIGFILFSLIFVMSTYAFIELMKVDERFPALIMFLLMAFSSVLAVTFGATTIGF